MGNCNLGTMVAFSVALATMSSLVSIIESKSLLSILDEEGDKDNGLLPKRQVTSNS